MSSVKYDDTRRANVDPTCCQSCEPRDGVHRDKLETEIMVTTVIILLIAA